MKLTIVLLFSVCFSAWASDSYSQSTLISLDVKNATVEDVFEEIENKTEFRFLYNHNLVDLSKNVSLTVKDKRVGEILDVIFEEGDITWVIQDRQIIVMPVSLAVAESQAAAQQSPVSGRVTNTAGEAVGGVMVTVEGQSTGTVTDTDGRYSLRAQSGDVLRFAMLGYKTASVTVGAQSRVDVTLEVDVTDLEAIVVTALGIRRGEKGLGYAVQNVSGEALTTVKTVDFSTALTGKVAGMNVRNSTEFNEAPSIQLRGESPLLVVDGVPSRNLSLRDIAADDIASISVLKGATAAALYGESGSAGAIMITTKKGSGDDSMLSVEVNSSSMFTAGYLTLPKVQTGYSSGIGGKFDTDQYVWGDKLDIGRTATQYNPFTYEWEADQPLVSKGKNNLKNFQQLSYILNNNVSVSQQGSHGGFRTSLTHVYNKGQFPNTQLHKFTASVSGNINFGGFTLDAGITYNKRAYPNSMGIGYGQSGYIYNLLLWSGSEYDIRDFKDYWVAGREGYEQNWRDQGWYNNPYYIAHEIIHSEDYDIVNGYMNAAYEFAPWLQASLRLGVDAYSDKEEWRNPVGAFGGWDRKGYYYLRRGAGFTSSNDFILTSNNKIGDFGIDALLGGSLYYESREEFNGETQNGIIVPGFYSLAASVDPVKADQWINRWQTNSIYGKLTLSWKSVLFVDVTGRNDWTSTLSKDQLSYFYPSVAGSLVLSDLFKLPKEISLLKLRGSWTQTKSTPGVYAIKSSYSISSGVWNDYNAAYYPGSIRNMNINPASSRSYEFGLASNFFAGRLHFDIAFYNKLFYDRMVTAPASEASGFTGTYRNTGEDLVRKGVEITLGGTPVKQGDWRWDVTLNWSRDRQYYAALDPESQDRPWIKVGERYDWVIPSTGYRAYETDPDGNVIHGNSGLPIRSNYDRVLGYTEPDWIWGINNTVRWRSLVLDFSFDGRIGGTSYNNTEWYMWTSGSHIKSDTQWRYDEVVNGERTFIAPGVKVVSGSAEYDPYGNIISDTRQYAPNDVATSYENYLMNTGVDPFDPLGVGFYNQTFLKLRHLSLSWELPGRWTDKIGMKNVAVSFIGQNLLLWTKDFKYSDPDKASDNINSPSIRYMGGSVKFNF